MQLLAAAASLVCLGTALALECGVRKDFSAATFDAVNFAPGVSYHDVTNGIILNENLLDDGAMFFVKAAGIFYIKTPDGSCIKFEAPLLDLKTEEFLHYVDRAGVPHAGIAEVTEILDMRLLVNEDTCFTEFTLTKDIDGSTWSFIHTDHKDLTAEDREYLQATQKEFEALGCSPLTL
ncbi:hypothetical protein RRG08_049702 [Elysia crispata]|uniref:Uncharacterized protein n=1 Tax=Elysia crispata TaxID=231223 RepID=A0AAE1DYI7_9GAST|nr:hypothetical protein RRG08_049702 [Elysia crispata]